VLVLLTWVLFRADSLSAAGRYLAAMFGLAQAATTSVLLAAELYTVRNLLTMALAAALVIQPAQAFDWSQRRPGLVAAAALVTLFALALAVMATQAFTPFLYSQF
jgi:alginate O-acetyltransferase complex protein AlgI